MIRGTGKTKYEWEGVRTLILRRRLQLLVHSYLYYRLDDPIITDAQYDLWAKELAQLQKENPRIASRVDYSREFRGFEGSTGFDLPYHYPEIENKALHIQHLRKQKTLI